MRELSLHVNFLTKVAMKFALWGTKTVLNHYYSTTTSELRDCGFLNTTDKCPKYDYSSNSKVIQRKQLH